MSLPKQRHPVAAGIAAVLLLLAALPSLYVQHQHTFADFAAAPGLTGVRAMEIRHGGAALTAFGEFTPKWRTAPFDNKVLAELGPDFEAEAGHCKPPGRSDGAVGQGAQRRMEYAAGRIGPSNGHATSAILSALASHPGPATLALSPQPETGYTQFALPAGEHTVTLWYGRTAVETAGLIVSGLTLLGRSQRLVGSVWGRRRASKQAERPGRLHTNADFAPPVWLLVTLAVLLVLKVVVIDQRTTLFRCVSTSGHVCDAETSVNGPFVVRPACVATLSILSRRLRAGRCK